MDHTEDGDEARVTMGSEIQSESAEAALGTQPTLGECRSGTDSEVNIYSHGVIVNEVLRKVISDATTAVAKKKGLTTKFVARAYMSYVLDDDVGLFEIHRWNDASVNEEGEPPVDQCEDVGEQYNVSLNEHATLSPNAHDTMPTRGEFGGLDLQITALNDEFNKLKEDKDRV
ncbi:hypothetical protein GIB67_019834 [Kingdonia uniflora]|uniref:Uncharacterized protein n=1 Tax=Kingdonia uniflora TaxID=39325 RepID=A0A7J7MKN9_9MAGN|nr:hypothetical protein GIB67_019834 [Kingdonia uniflora]